MLRDGLAAGAAGAAIGGLPSTLHALATGGDPLQATAAAGAILLPHEQRRARLVAAAVPVHLAISLAWGITLAATLPRRHTTAWGAVAGLAIAALDLGLGRRFFPEVRELRLAPQIADHILYGTAAGALLSHKWQECSHSCRCGPLKAHPPDQ